MTESNKNIPDQRQQPNEPMTDQMYLELVEQLNDKFKDFEYLKNKLLMQNGEMKKEIITAYSLIRVLDNLISNAYEIDADIVCFSEITRGHLSHAVNSYL